METAMNYLPLIDIDGGVGLIRAVLFLGRVRLKEILQEEHRKRDTKSWS